MGTLTEPESSIILAERMDRIKKSLIQWEARLGDCQEADNMRANWTHLLGKLDRLVEMTEWDYEQKNPQ